MQYEVLVFGRDRFMATGETLQDLLKQVAFFHSLPQTCEICFEGLGFVVRTVDAGDYYEMRCAGPIPHTAQLSQHKPQQGGGLYWNKKKYPFQLAYDARTQGEQDQPPTRADFNPDDAIFDNALPPKQSAPQDTSTSKPPVPEYKRRVWALAKNLRWDMDQLNKEVQSFFKNRFSGAGELNPEAAEAFAKHLGELAAQEPVF